MVDNCKQFKPYNHKHKQKPYNRQAVQKFHFTFFDTIASADNTEQYN